MKTTRKLETKKTVDNTIFEKIYMECCQFLNEYTTDNEHFFFQFIFSVLNEDKICCLEKCNLTTYNDWQNNSVNGQFNII